MFERGCMKYPITMYQDEDGWYIVEYPIIPGCLSQGETVEEATSNIQEAIRLCLEVRLEKGLPLTIDYFESKAAR
jgi:predicted RNase H-like HicB family nuclease